MSRRHCTRIVRAVAAAVVAGTALAGCSVTVAGAPHAAPQTSSPTPTPTAPRTTAPTPTPPSVPGLGDQPEVVAQWVADGWIPRPLVPVTDQASGASAWLFGTTERRDAGGGGNLYRSVGAPASVVNHFAVFPIPSGYEPDAEQAATSTATANGGRVISTRPVTVEGYRGLDVRIEFADPQGRPIVELVRYVELPQYLVAVESLGLSSDEPVLQQVQQVVADKLTFSSV